MSTANKLNKLLNTKQAIKQAIVDKGVEVGDDTKFSDYPAKINAIQTGDTESVWEIVTDNWTRLQYLFYNCKSLTSLDLSNFNTSNVTNMSNMFGFCSSLTTLDLSNFNTSNVTSMQSMFANCNNLTSLDVSNFDTSNVTSMQSMFANCNKLTTLDSSNFNTSNVTSMQSMFQYCESLTTLDLSNFNTSNVTNIQSMFYNCESLTTLDVSNFDVSKITSDYSLNIAFNYCKSLVDFYPPKNIGVSMNVGNSTVLSHDSLIRIINNLKAVTSTKTLTLGTDNLAKLTADEVAIATNKGWTVK